MYDWVDFSDRNALLLSGTPVSDWQRWIGRIETAVQATVDAFEREN
jgi:hypothetical protein